MSRLFLGLMSSAFAWITASTTAESEDHLLQIMGRDGHAFHEHGGLPASLGQARFSIRWQGEAPTPLTVKRIAYLTGHDCEAPPTRVLSEPRFEGLVMEGAQVRATTVTLAPKSAQEVVVGFAAVSAYYSHCDRFAFRVTFVAGERTVAAIAETGITRMEPYREPIR